VPVGHGRGVGGFLMQSLYSTVVTVLSLSCGKGLVSLAWADATCHTKRDDEYLNGSPVVIRPGAKPPGDQGLNQCIGRRR